MRRTVRPVVLAGGFGQITTGTSKLVELLGGKPIIQWSVEALLAAGFEHPLVIINSYFGSQIPDALAGFGCEFFKQSNNIGSAGALQEAIHEGVLDCDHIVMSVADLPFVTSETYRALAQTHLDRNAAVTVTTYAPAPEADEWSRFSEYGVVLRDHQNNVLCIAKGQTVINDYEVDAGPWAIDISFFTSNFPHIRPDAKLEKSVVALPHLAYQHGRHVATNPARTFHEALGINTRAHLEEAQLHAAYFQQAHARELVAP